MYDGEIFSFTNFPLFGSDFFFTDFDNPLSVYVCDREKAIICSIICCTNFLHSFICSHYCHFFDGMRSGLFSRDIFRKAAIGENRRKIAKLGFR